MDENDQVFYELPEALVEEALSKSEEIGNALHESFEELHKMKEGMRKQLEKENLLGKDSDLPPLDAPTSCGVDGSYAVERLLAVDLVACAGVAVEGITPPSEKRFWDSPRHRVYIKPQAHNPDTGTILRGLMISMEMELAVKAPHDIVFLDGSFSTPLIYANQAVNKALENKDLEVSKELVKNFDSFLKNYEELLSSKRSDKLWVSVPKYTTKREIGRKFGWPDNYDDRAALTSILSPGEFTQPELVPVGPPPEPWHLKLPNGASVVEFDSLLKSIRVAYYKPYPWVPALRLELTSSAAANKSQLGMLFQGIKAQCVAAGILEPYPLYLADKMVKHLGSAVPAFRQVATRKMMELQSSDDSGEIFFGMHGYRTET